MYQNPIKAAYLVSDYFALIGTSELYGVPLPDTNMLSAAIRVMQIYVG
jgi:hypothetical protein